MRGAGWGGGGNLKLLEIRVLQNLVSSGRVAGKVLGMEGRERDILTKLDHYFWNLAIYDVMVSWRIV